MTVLVLVLLGLPLIGLAAISLVFHAVLGITLWLLGGQLVVAALIFAGSILAGVHYARRRPIVR
jgi:hypothetical protein